MCFYTPMGIFYVASAEYDEHVLWNDVLLPICPNMIGGILLYSERLTEDVANHSKTAGGICQ